MDFPLPYSSFQQRSIPLVMGSLTQAHSTKPKTAAELVILQHLWIAPIKNDQRKLPTVPSIQTSELSYFECLKFLPFFRVLPSTFNNSYIRPSCEKTLDGELGLLTGICLDIPSLEETFVQFLMRNKVILERKKIESKTGEKDRVLSVVQLNILGTVRPSLEC